MKLLKNLSLMSLAVMFLLSFSCTPKAETEEVATEAAEIEAVVEEASEPKMDSTVVDMMDSTAVEVIEAVDSASMEN